MLLWTIMVSLGMSMDHLITDMDLIALTLIIGFPFG